MRLYMYMYGPPGGGRRVCSVGGASAAGAAASGLRPGLHSAVTHSDIMINSSESRSRPSLDSQSLCVCARMCSAPGSLGLRQVRALQVSRLRP
eukprot:3455402-Rhodomonas_salina.1